MNSLQWSLQIESLLGLVSINYFHWYNTSYWLGFSCYNHHIFQQPLHRNHVLVPNQSPSFPPTGYSYLCYQSAPPLQLFARCLQVSLCCYVKPAAECTYMHIIRDPHVFDLVVEVSLSIVLFQWDSLVVGMNWGLWLIIDWVSLVVYLELLILLFANNVIEYTVRDTSFVRYTCMGVLWSLFLSQLIEFSFIIGEVFSNTNRSMSFCPWLIVKTLLDFHLILVKIII